MRKLIMLAVAAMALAIPAASMAATGTTTCTDDRFKGKIVTTNLTVPAGETCNVGWDGAIEKGTTIEGNVTVNGRLVTYGAVEFKGNVAVNGGSFQLLNGGWVTFDRNLSFLNPAAGSENGFWGNQGPNVVKGNLSYTISPDKVYPEGQSPYLYFGDNAHTTQLVGSLTVSNGDVRTGGLDLI